MEVNREVRYVALGEWVLFWEVDGPRSWVWFELERFYSIEMGPEAQEQIAELVRTDLVPWVREWPSQYLELLRISLEYGFAHDRAELAGLEEWTSLCAAEDVVEAVWRPLFDGVFETEPRWFPADEYRVLTDWEANRQLVGFVPAPPSWEWLAEAEAEAARRRREQRTWLRLLPSFEDRYLPRDEQYERFGRSYLAEGKMAIDAARAWFLMHPDELWPLPAAGPIAPTERDWCVNDLRAVYCSDERAGEWHSTRQLPAAFSALEARLAQSGAALGLPVSNSLEQNIALALEKEAASNFEYEPWKSWATVAQALIDARERDLFLCIP